VARILVIDDDEDIRDVVQLVLGQAGHQVRCAENGRVALDMVADSEPELILLDMRMPVMDGWEFMRLYRATPEPRGCVIVLTAARDARAWAAQVGADGYLAKPFDLRDLIAVIDRPRSGD
jgi:CheY-like chemotaxis protein